ncbi:MAG: hypothetical protein R3E79_47380 [Caldilineaceae bacterium]
MTDEEVSRVTEQLLAHLATQGNRLTLDFQFHALVTQGEHTAGDARVLPIDQADGHAYSRPGQPTWPVWPPTIDGAPVVPKRDIYPLRRPGASGRRPDPLVGCQGLPSRLGRRQVLGGYIGRATYHAPDWRPLLPGFSGAEHACGEECRQRVWRVSVVAGSW